jgi:alkylation response protein AidB-like acyl-CoA dehydrogenase
MRRCPDAPAAGASVRSTQATNVADDGTERLMTTTFTSRAIQDGAAASRASATLDAVRALAAEIATRSDEIEIARRLPLDLVEQLRAAGCFRLAVPHRHGGSGASLPEHLEVVRELAIVDGSVGWTVMIGSLAPMIAGALPPATFDSLFANGPDFVGAGSFNPSGVARPVTGGYRVSGRWGFASGCQHADWLLAHCVVDDGRMPPLRMMAMPVDEATILDTWTVSGLCGTGSHDFTLDDVFVPEAHTFSIFEPSPSTESIAHIPELVVSSFAIATVAVGIAEGAVAELTTMSTAKVPMFASAPLAANPLFRHRLGEMSAHLRAARAALDMDVAAAWASALAGDEPTVEQRARWRSTAVWVTTACAEVVDAAYTAGGGSALYARSPLQRRLRDIHAVTQHFAVKSDTLTLAGAVLANQDVDLSFL